MKKIKFKDLTDADIAKMRDLYFGREKYALSVEKLAINLANEYDVSERTIRKWFSKLNFGEKPEILPEQYEVAKQRKINKKQDKFIITWAQNNTPIHSGFLTNIQAYAEFLSADIHVIAGRYKNPTSVFTDKDSEFWDDKVIPYLDANRHNVHKYLSIMSDIKIQPTATNPMSGLQGMSGINTCIFGAPKTQLEMIPVLEGYKPKMMLTTGSLTKSNYTDSKAGKKGEFHHIYGFTIVEIKDKETFYVRQVTADDKTGSFTDLCYYVNNGSVKKSETIEAIILGDVHYGHHDEELLKLTHEYINKTKPNHVVLHDVFDGDSISHHQIKDPFIQYGKEIDGSNDLSKELENMIYGLKEFENYKNVMIVRSNHDDFLDRWLKNEDWKKQPTPKNSRVYMTLSNLLLEQYELGGDNIKGVIPAIINNTYPNFKTLGRNSSYRVKNWELALHGDVGTNGSRGSIEQFRKLNTKIVVGHSHTPARKDGALSVGTSTKLRVGYNVGPSSWLNTHVIIHNDGKAQHINLIRDINNKMGFTTFDI